jgi:hypothetical protein
MRLHTQSEVLPGNIYPAGITTSVTEYSFIALSLNGGHLIGFDLYGRPWSTATYPFCLRERPVIGRVDLGELVIKEAGK